MIPNYDIYKKSYFAFKPTNLHETELQLKYLLLEENVSQQKFVTKKKLDITNITKFTWKDRKYVKNFLS